MEFVKWELITKSVHYPFSSLIVPELIIKNVIESVCEGRFWSPDPW